MWVGEDYEVRDRASGARLGSVLQWITGRGWTAYSDYLPSDCTDGRTRRDAALALWPAPEDETP